MILGPLMILDFEELSPNCLPIYSFPAQPLVSHLQPVPRGTPSFAGTRFLIDAS
jgi:hypothetical protein